MTHDSSTLYQDFQGRESRVIIISCVRSRPRFLKEDATKGLGLVFERKRSVDQRIPTPPSQK